MHVLLGPGYFALLEAGGCHDAVHQGQKIVHVARGCARADGKGLASCLGAQGLCLRGQGLFKGHPVELAAAIAQGIRHKCCQTLCLLIEQGIAACSYHVHGHVGDSVVPDKHKLNSVFKRYGLAPLCPGSRCTLRSLGSLWPFAFQDGGKVANLCLFRGKQAHADPFRTDVVFVRTLNLGKIHAAQGLAHIGLAKAPAHLEFHLGPPGGQAVQCLGLAVKVVLCHKLGPGKIVCAKVPNPEFGEIAHKLGKELVCLVRIQNGGNGEKAHSGKTHVAHGDAVHKAQVVAVLALEGCGAISGKQIGQKIQVKGCVVAKARHREGKAQIDLVPLAPDYFHAPLVGKFQTAGFNGGLGFKLVSVCKGGEVLLHIGAHGFRVHVACDHKQHVLGLVPGVDIGS